MKIGFYFKDYDVVTELVWVSTKELDRLWKSSDPEYIKSWDGEANYTWFLPNKTLIVPELSITASNEETEITFKNGRHRTRWLIQQDLIEIPVGLPVQQIEYGKKIGLITRDFENQEPVEINDEAIGQALLKRRNTIKETDDSLENIDDIFDKLRRR